MSHILISLFLNFLHHSNRQKVENALQIVYKLLQLFDQCNLQQLMNHDYSNHFFSATTNKINMGALHAI